jgi:hypothetical protein
MAMKRFRTVYSLWALVAVGVFVALGFVDPVAGAAKGDNSFWSLLGVYNSGDMQLNLADMRPNLVFRAGLQVVPAILIGWVAHAMIVIVWSSIRRTPSDGGSITQPQTSTSFSPKSGK